MFDGPGPAALEIVPDGGLENRLLQMARWHGDLIVTLDRQKNMLRICPLADWPVMKDAAEAAGEAAWRAFWETWRERSTAQDGEGEGA